MPLTGPDVDALREAKRLLERPSLAARLTDKLGAPVEALMERLPEKAREKVRGSVEAALEKGLDVALRTLDPADPRPARRGLHRAAVAGTGAVGGAFGLAGLPVELPITTTLLLRSIAAIAREEGHDLSDPAVRLSCLEVFALGGSSRADDAAETGYYAVRAVLARAVSEAAAFVAERGVASRGAPPLVRLIAAVASRFGVVVGERAAASLVPVVGALGGAAVNDVFLRHFQDVARGHFVVKRLEALHGADEVRATYDALAV